MDNSNLTAFTVSEIPFVATVYILLTTKAKEPLKELQNVSRISTKRDGLTKTPPKPKADR